MQLGNDLGRSLEDALSYRCRTEQQSKREDSGHVARDFGGQKATERNECTQEMSMSKYARTVRSLGMVRASFVGLANYALGDVTEVGARADDAAAAPRSAHQ